MSKTILRHTLIKKIFLTFLLTSLSLYIFTIWKCIVYHRLCRDGIYFAKISLSEYKLFKRSNKVKIKNIIQLWSKRSLTLFGKVAIIKSLIVPQLTYLLSVLPTTGQNYLKDIDSLIFNFLWDNKPPKIKREVILQKTKTRRFKHHWYIYIVPTSNLWNFSRSKSCWIVHLKALGGILWNCDITYLIKIVFLIVI